MSKIAILDFGNEYNEEVKNVIYSYGLEGQIMAYNTRAQDLESLEGLKGIVLSGGYITIREDDLEAFDSDILNMGLPVLGLGRGMQVIIHDLGGTVTPAGYIYEPTESRLDFHNTEEGIFKDLESERIVPLGYDAKVSQLPDGFDVLASGKEVHSGDDRPFGAMENKDRRIYGIQFLTSPGQVQSDKKAIENFLDICMT